MTDQAVAIIGAGPYGLSLAAHLGAAAVSYRIFGQPMRPWRDRMPPGMFLKSDGASSSLSDPAHEFPIARFYRDTGRVFRVYEPIPVETFITYGQEFQRRYVPLVDTRDVIEINHTGTAFALRLTDGDLVYAARVVLAVGIAPFAHVPPALRDLPSALASHASEYGPVDAFRGRDVAVIGSGASAIDLAAALHDHGARVQILSRRSAIPFQDPPSEDAPGLLSRILFPGCGIGSGWKLKLCADWPGLFHVLPEPTRMRIAREYLGPAPGWFMHERVLGQIPVQYGVTPGGAEPANGRVQLELRLPDGSPRRLLVDHIIAATGYRIDVRRLGFLSPLLRAMRTRESAPALSQDFETSIPGLYIIGPAALMDFGPVMRFVFGADFAARRVSACLSRSLGRHASRADRTVQRYHQEVMEN